MSSTVLQLRKLLPTKKSAPTTVDGVLAALNQTVTDLANTGSLTTKVDKSLASLMRLSRI